MSNHRLRSEKVLNQSFRTGVRLPSSPSPGAGHMARNLPRNGSFRRGRFSFAESFRLPETFSENLQLVLTSSLRSAIFLPVPCAYAPCTPVLYNHSAVFREMRERIGFKPSLEPGRSRKSNQCFGGGATGGSEGVATESDLTGSEGQLPMTRKGSNRETMKWQTTEGGNFSWTRTRKSSLRLSASS